MTESDLLRTMPDDAAEVLDRISKRTGVSWSEMRRRRTFGDVQLARYAAVLAMRTLGIDNETAARIVSCNTSTTARMRKDKNALRLACIVVVEVLDGSGAE